MTFLKGFLYHSTAIVHKILLLALPLVFSLAVLLSSPTPIEKALKESRLYDEFVSSVIDKSEKEATNKDAKDILAQPEIQAAAEKAFTPALLQSSTENVLEGVFAWAQGKTTEPEFRIDLTNAKAELAKGIAAYAEKRANSLPPCSVAQLRTLSPDIDLLEVPCLPPGFNAAAQADAYSQKFLSEGDFLKDPVITNKTIADNNNGKSVSEQLSAVPKAYAALNAAKWLILGAVLLLTALLIFARKNRVAGAKHVAWTLLGVGIFLAILMIVYWYVFDKAQASPATADKTSAMWMDGIKSLITDFNRTLSYFTAGYLLVGASILGYLRLRPGEPANKAHEHKPKEEDLDEVSAAESADQKAVKPADKEPEQPST